MSQLKRWFGLLTRISNRNYTGVGRRGLEEKEEALGRTMISKNLAEEGTETANCGKMSWDEEYLLYFRYP